ncbi:DUF4031 domain-containing protein [Pseudomonas sp. AU12215]|uniref:DUF4031 domain-containing protein n=1 Tax=Pseudomonas sp. AU12215 TaxID=1860123 RepID=UPI0007EE2A5E|nr:DUF4031 domain-containing protein [Pseudomonas sp. AU12215]OBY58206.1 hypothetical protein A9513_011920 [Pseudomonas sp. AU12215]
MAVYVDDMRAPFGRLIMCHMVADSEDELLAMADKIGVKRRWHQHPGGDKSHFDICLAKRALAVAAGAVEIEARQTVELVRNKRQLRLTAETTYGGE